MKKREFFTTLSIVGLAVALWAVGSVPSSAAGGHQGLIIKASKPYDQIISEIREMGGVVTHQYKYVDAIAVRVPADRAAGVAGLAGVESVYKDVFVNSPKPMEAHKLSEGEVLGTQALELEDLESLPANYRYNNLLTGAEDLHFQGLEGEGVIVAIIDSGTANSPAVPAIYGSVIGGESFVPGDTEPGATSTLNDPHGTWVGNMVAAHANFLFSSTSRTANSLLKHSPISVIPCRFVPGCPSSDMFIIPMFGTAPEASLYALKTFPANGGGAPESRIIAAMERAIELKENFNNGLPSDPIDPSCGDEDNPCVYDSLDIQVVNMSLGGPTLFAGRDMEDALTRKMLDVGMTLVTSAGNDGFAAMTGGSPGTGMGSLTVGAASTVVHERVLRDVQYGLGTGELYRPTDHNQIADFSARGPTADGRYDPEMVANGFASFAQGSDGFLYFVSGTSFSSPTVAGAAALLRGAVTDATAMQVRNALVETANPDIVDAAGRIDEGLGFLDIPAALNLLKNADAETAMHLNCLPQFPTRSVRMNIRQLGFRTYGPKDTKTFHLENLLPGQVEQIFINSNKRTDRITVRVENITPELPPDQQNTLFGDDIYLHIVDAPTSFEDRRFLDFVWQDFEFDIPNPQTGIVRIAVMGDWTNAGRVSADVVVTREQQFQIRPSARAKLAEGDASVVLFDVPAGTKELVFEASWRNTWGHYPTNDIDMILIDPLWQEHFDGATLSSPERVVISNPQEGFWIVFLEGFTVHFGEREYVQLRVTADGVRLRKE